MKKIIDIRNGIKECNDFTKDRLSHCSLNICTHYLPILVSIYDIYYHVLYLFANVYLYNAALSELFCVNENIIMSIQQYWLSN